MAQQPATAAPASLNGSPRNSLRSNHSSKGATPPPTQPAARNGLIIIDSLSVSPKAKGKELENNNSSKIINKNSANTNKMQQQQQQENQLLQQIIDQQSTESQKQLKELLHANKGVEALGVLVQYLVYNVSTCTCNVLLDHLTLSFFTFAECQETTTRNLKRKFILIMRSLF